MPTEPSTQPKYKKGKIHEIPLDQLHRDIDQPRKHFDESELEALKQSIEEKGLLYPILFRVDENDCNIIVSGERRFKAYQALGKDKIPAMLVGSERHEEVALIDNILRVQLNIIDEAEALQNLKAKYEYTQEQIGSLIGKAHNTVSETLALNALSDDIREDARHRELSRAALVKIARLKKASAQRKAYDALVASVTAPQKVIKRTRLTVPKKTISATNNALKCLKDITPESLGDDKERVVTKLQELLVEIQNKLAAIGS